ncbi:MAG: hypothetical protein AAF329_07215 [Cyanobacteria bacterium P01_A01_bin.17]
MPNQLQVLIKPCSSGTCPAIYKDAEGRLFLQGNKLKAAVRQEVAIAEHEDVVEISPDLIDYLRTL